MNDIEYILRLVLKARDEMAAVLSKARTEIRAFARDADKMNSSVTNLNQAMKNFDGHMDGVTKKLESWRAILRDAGSDSDKATKSLDGFAKSADRTVTATQRAAQSQKTLQADAVRLRKEVESLTAARQKEAVSADFASTRYKKLAKDLEEVSLKMSDASRARSPAQRWADEARDAADRIDDVNRDITADLKAAEAKRTADAKQAAETRKQIAKEILDAGLQDTRERNAINKSLDEESTRDSERILRHRVDSEINIVTEGERAKAAARKQQQADDLRSQRQADRETEARAKRAEEAAKREAELAERAVALRRRAAVVTPRVQAGQGSASDIAELRRAQAEYKKLANAYSVGSREARQFGAEAERLGNILRSNANDSDSAGNSAKRLSDRFHGAGLNVAGFDNQLRGLGVLAAVVSIQQLISAAIALGGELVSLAGSAVMAGGALGGALAAGAAQALPVIGLLAGAFQRVKSVMGAVQQAQTLQKAQYTDAEKGAQKVADKTNALANAHDAQREAIDRLADSRKALTVAQADGARQLEDLIYQEKAAALAARGASLNVKEAQKALRDAVAGGASALEVQQRQQALDEARQGAGRARVTATRATEDRQQVGGKIENLDSVKNAAKSVADAEKAVNKADRGLAQAADKADRTAASTMTAAANLDFLLSQLSPAERRLYEALNKTYETYKRVFQGTGTGGSGIYGVIVDSFTRAVERANEIMKMPDVVKTIQDLADSIASAIDKIVNSFTDAKGLDQLQKITEDASKNLGPVVDIATDLGHAFLNIAETANPAFRRLIGFVGRVVDKFLDLTSNKDAMKDFFKSGEDSLESWLKLGLSVIRLFAVLTGQSSKEGKRSVDDLTKTIDGWTDKLRDNGDKVRHFFSEARKAAYSIAGVLVDIGKALFESFSAQRVETFAKVLKDTIIPALAGVIDAVGQITDWIIKLTSNPVGAWIAKAAIGFFLFSKVASSVIGVFGGLMKSIGSVIGGFEKISDVAKKVPGGINKIKDGVAGATKGMRTFAAQMQVNGVAMEAMGGKMGLLGKAVTAFGRAIPLMLGPWGLVLAAVIIGIVLLLKHFGKLDDIWDAIKKAMAGFMKDIEPALKALQDALEGLGVHIGSMKDVLEFLNEAGKQLADFITTYLIDTIQGAFKVLAGIATFLIRTIAGLIKAFHGVADVVIGFFRLITGGGGDQIKKGFKEIADGIVDIFWGVFDGIKLAFSGIVKIFLAPFHAAWNAIKEFFGIASPSKLAARLGRDIIHGLVNGAKAALRALERLAGWIWDKIRDGFRALGGAERRLASWLIDKFVDFIKLEIRGFEKVGHWIWNAIKDAVRSAGHLAAGIASWLWNKWTGLLRAEIRGWVNVGTWIWNALSDAVKGIGGKLLDLGKSIGGKIVSGIKSAVGAVKGVFGFGDDDKKAAPAQKQATADEVNKATGVIPFGAKDLDTAQKMYGNFWKGMRDTTRVTTNAIQKEFRDMKNSTAANADKMYKAVRGSLADIQKSFSVRGDTIVKNWSADWFDLMKVTNQGLFYIGHETNQALHAMGEKRINYGLSSPRKPDTKDGKAVGGWIGRKGERGKDRGFYPLGAGEAVLNWAHQSYVEPAMNAFYGHGLGEMFGRVRGFHAGGPEQPGFASGVPAMRKVPAPWGQSNEEVNATIYNLLARLQKQYHFLVTDAFDRDHSAGHKSPGHNVTGTAVDMVPGRGGSWNLIEALGRWAVGKHMVVGYGAGVPGSQAWPGHGRNNHIHIEFGGHGGDTSAGAVEHIRRRIVTGRHTATAKLVQSALDRVLNLSNKKLDESGTGPDGAGGPTQKGALSVNQFQNVVRHALTILGIKSSIGEWVRTMVRQAQHESSLVPTARNDTAAGRAAGGPKGILQVVDGTFAANKAPGHGNVFNALDNTLASIKYVIGAYGHGDADRAVRVLWGRGGGAYAEGGMVNGPDGAPVPILAHAGEWILNKGQQLRAAMLSGLSVPGLKSVLGFHGKGGEMGYAGGTEVADHPRRIPIAPVTTLRTLFADFDDTWKGIAEIARIMRQQRRAKKLNAAKISKDYQEVIDLIDNITGDAGIGAVANTIAANLARTQAKLKRAAYRVMAGGRVRRVIQDGGDLDKQLAALVTQAHGLYGERSDILDGLKLVNRQLKKVAGDKTLSKKQRQTLVTQLEAQRKNLLDNQDRINSEIADSVEARWQAQADIQQKAVDDINKRHEDRAGRLDLRKRIATALGNQTGVDAVNQSIASNIQGNINDLQKRIASAKKIGNTPLVEALNKQIADLRVQLIELAAQALQDAIDAVGKAASRRGTTLDLFGRMADAMGLVGNAAQAVIPGIGGVASLGAMSRAQIAQGRIDSATAERAGYLPLLDRARAQGNVGQVEALTDKINELTVTIVEATKAQRDMRVQAEQEAYDYNTSINDLNTQLIQATDAVSGQTSTADLLRLATEKQTLLVAHQNELQAELNDAIAAGDQKAIQDLNRALLESKIAVQNNTKAVNDLNGAGSGPASYTSTAWQWFRSAFLTGTGGVLPQYTAPIMSDMSSIGPGGTSSTTNNGATIVTNIEINEAGQPIDPTQIASTVVFAQSTAQ